MKVLFYPDKIRKRVISLNELICQRMKWHMTTDINDRWDFSFYWNFNEKNVTPKELMDDKRLVFNRRCNDVTKSKVDRVFKNVFGYTSEGNTNRYGYCVKKNEGQCKKDFEIVNTPCENKQGYFYQIFFNNRIKVNWTREYRFYICMDKSIMVVRDKTVEGTFIPKKGKQETFVDDVRNHFTRDEQEKIMEVCNLLGLDLGAVDVIRDYSTGKVYVLDINNICGYATPVTNLVIEPFEKLIYDKAMSV